MVVVLRASLAAALLALGVAGSAFGAETSELLRQFADYSGARLVFQRSDLPPGGYHDIMRPLTPMRQNAAAEICLREVRKYPPGYLGKMGLKAIGVFAACASRSGDGFRPFDAELGGYRYYGIWNGDSGIAAAYYTDGQLPLTFHHEIFHHVDGTRAGVNDASRFFASDDGEFREAIAGERRYVSPLISDDDLAALRRVREGSLLRGAVSDYSAKAAGEDQAETARHFMTTLPDSLVQIVERPDLPGSQRILHCLSQYNEATVDGPDVNWFVDIALGRASAPKAAAGDIATVGAVLPAKPSKEQIFAQIDRIAEMHSGQWEALVKQQDAARQALAAAAEIDAAQLSPEESQRLFEQAAAVTHSLLRARLKATDDYDTRYAIWGTEDASGVNWTLRRDVQTFAADARRLKQLARLSPKEEETLTRAQLKGLRLVARYYAFIDRNWSVSDGTQQVFDAARDAFAESLPAAQSSLASQLKSLPLDDLALRLPVDGAPKLLDPPAPKRLELPHRVADNPYTANIDRAIAQGPIRDAIHAVQPACVRFPNASGCCISPDGVILTAAHVAGKLGRRMIATFPDGSQHMATCTAFSDYLDLAVMKIEGEHGLPYASLAPDAPEVGDWICAIGQPGGHTPTGEPTGYGAFYVSTGQIRGFKTDRLGYQMLGAAKHDAWTYWGHSGCPLFNQYGQICAMHNSWDSTTAMRYGVTYEAIVHFLKESKVDFAMSE